LIALLDPLRDHVKKAIKRATKAKITTRICTNNSLETTVAQAIDAGLLPASYLDNDDSTKLEGQAMLGSELTKACGGLK
jgi:magnesium-transporting ATPase (P-type)